MVDPVAGSMRIETGGYMPYPNPYHPLAVTLVHSISNGAALNVTSAVVPIDTVGNPGPLCSLAWRRLDFGFPTSAAELIWWGGFREHGLGSVLSYGADRTGLHPFPFMRGFDADDMGPNSTVGGATVSQWISDDEVGNFGSATASWDVFVGGDTVGVPHATSFQDSLHPPDGGSSGDTQGDAVYNDVELNAKIAPGMFPVNVPHC
eukprot:TRINITY_DN55096_c0_g1_i1.p1 TRINITY_DN55096_c0_g1~~TRINITY_DN55096_c0_g1_i1.p1  ORF type:complete len:205 (+),score=29.49 TRINITY_DN55096_c0_g1_i1:339-953(+)